MCTLKIESWINNFDEVLESAVIGLQDKDLGGDSCHSSKTKDSEISEDNIISSCRLRVLRFQNRFSLQKIYLKCHG